MKLKLRHYVGPVFGLVLFIIAMWWLRATLHKHHYHDIIESLSGLSYTQVLLALMLTAGNYLVLTFYDTLAFRTIKLPLAYHRIALGSFLGYVFSHNIGLSVLGSGAARYRVYSSWGISTPTPSRWWCSAGSPSGSVFSSWRASRFSSPWPSRRHCR